MLAVMANGPTCAMPAADGTDRAGDDLVTRAAHGDREAFAQIVAAHHARVSRLAYRLLGWSGDVEDVVQDVFVAAWENLPGFRRGASLSTWLTAIAVNRCRSWCRRQAVRAKLLAAMRLGSRPPRAAPPAAAIRREARERVRAAVRALPARLREVVVLRYLEEMPPAEVAQALRISPPAVATRLHRARERLKGMLAETARPHP
jgi:RNA polymerase sigma factor (sigma-70 family)